MKTENAYRVLLLAPTRRDGEIACKLFARVNLGCVVCNTAQNMANEFMNGAGALILSDEAFLTQSIGILLGALRDQPNWSDVPVIVLTSPSQDSLRTRSMSGFLTNVMIVDRPAPMRSLVSAVQSAVRSRERQYEIRDQLHIIRRAAEEFELLADAIPQLAWMAHPNGKIFWYNRRWTEYTGTTIDDAGGSSWSQVQDPEILPIVRERWLESLEQGSPFEMEFPLRAADGTSRRFLTRAAPIRNESGEVIRWFGTNTDIEESYQIREVREEMLESERYARLEAERAARLKDEFLATLSHELRTPLSAILGWAYLLKLKGHDPKTVADGAEIIERNGRALSQLVADLLDLSRIISGKLRLDVNEIDLASVISKALESTVPAADAKRVAIDFEAPVTGPFFVGDADRLQQVLWNLLSNSVKFTPPEGKIKVSLMYSKANATITVSDTGEGISSDFLPYLFNRFSQADSSAARKHGGMGIGLSLVKQFVEMHGGTVAVDSPGPGLGSTFTIELPLSSIAEPRTGEPADQMIDLPNLGSCKILVVDDEPGVREFLSRLLHESGADVVTMSSAKDAFDSIESTVPDVLISDIGMPGEDGYELIRKIRDHGYQFPAISLTAFTRQEDHDKAIQCGFQHHLAKPVDPHMLLKVVQTSIAHSSEIGHSDD